MNDIQQENAQCPVCYNDINGDNDIILEQCGHTFCETCIMKWSKLKLSCPMCKLFFKSAIKVTNAASTVIHFEEPIESLYKESFDCFDIDYFLSEISKLKLYLDQSIHIILSHQFITDPRTGDRKESDSSPLYISQIESNLIEIETSLINNIRFEPENLLKELYDINECIKTLRRGNIPRLILIEESTPKRYSAENFDEIDEDEDELLDEEYDDYYY